MRTGSTARRAGALTVLCGVALAASATLAGPAAANDPALESCVSTDVNDGSGSHVLVPDVLVLDEENSAPYEGGSAAFTIHFPGDAGDGTFLVDGCIYVNGVAVGMWPAMEISNGGEYPLSFDVPAGAVAGDTVCVSAKTTGGPSAPVGSNRKALGCFDVLAEEDPVESESPEPSESSSPEPSVEPGDPEPTISPSVRGVRITRAAGPAPAAPTLPNTGSASWPLLALGLGLIIIGGTFVARAQRYQRQH